MTKEVGTFRIVNGNGDETGFLSGDAANLALGGSGAGGDIALKDGNSAQTIHLDGGDGNIRVGGGTHNGDIALFSDDGLMRMHLDGGRANIYAGGNGAAGDFALKDKDGDTVIHIDAGDGVIRIKGKHVQTADYVFDADYDLAPLDKVADHIAREKHLPGIPSAADMARDGVDMITMNRLLLEKVEELTLRLINMDKRVRELER